MCLFYITLQKKCHKLIDLIIIFTQIPCKSTRGEGILKFGSLNMSVQPSQAKFYRHLPPTGLCLHAIVTCSQRVYTLRSNFGNVGNSEKNIDNKIHSNLIGNAFGFIVCPDYQSELESVHNQKHQ